MKKHLSIDLLHVGMFVEAEVLSILVDSQVRHFLKPTEAKYVNTTAKRLRLSKRKHEQIANAGGMLMGSEKQIQALREIGVSEVLINTDKSDVLPDLPELARGTGEKERSKRATPGPAAVKKTAEGGYKWLTRKGRPSGYGGRHRWRMPPSILWQGLERIKR